MKVKKRENIGIYLSETNLRILEVITRMTGLSKTDVLRYVLTKSFVNAMWSQDEFDCPGLADEIKAVLANIQQ